MKVECCFLQGKNLDIDRETPNWYLGGRAIRAPYGITVRRATRAMNTQCNVPSWEFISSDWMDEVIQVFVVKVAGQETR